jgi:DNA invertase Pin-like site-specific DNA recombinase
MRNLSELFEYLTNCENETILKEIKIHGERLIRQEGSKAITKFKLDIEKLNTMLRLFEWYLTEEFHSDMKELVLKPEGDEIMTVNENASYLKTTTQTIYSLINKGKLDKMEISTEDKPGARPAVRIKRSEIDRFLEGK